MPVSKKRKKDGKVVKSDASKRAQRLEDAAGDLTSGVSLQDLINMLAYQEYQKTGVIDGPEIPDTKEPLPGENWVEDDENEEEHKDGQQ